MSGKRECHEYHLICRTTGQSHGGFATLAGAREFAREEDLQAWDIFHGHLLIERREPDYQPRAAATEADLATPADRGSRPPI
jgi:hypothetical protein